MPPITNSLPSSKYGSGFAPDEQLTHNPEADYDMNLGHGKDRYGDEDEAEFQPEKSRHNRKKQQQEKQAAPRVSKEIEDIIVHTAVNVFPATDRVTHKELIGYDVFFPSGKTLRPDFRYLNPRVEEGRRQKKAEKKKKGQAASTANALPTDALNAEISKTNASNTNDSIKSKGPSKLVLKHATKKPARQPEQICTVCGKSFEGLYSATACDSCASEDYSSVTTDGNNFQAPGQHSRGSHDLTTTMSDNINSQKRKHDEILDSETVGNQAKRSRISISSSPQEAQKIQEIQASPKRPMPDEFNEPDDRPQKRARTETPDPQSPSIESYCVKCGQNNCYTLDADPRGVTCSKSNCGKKCFSAEYLEENCGIKFADAIAYRQEHSEWLCLECTHQIEITHQEFLGANSTAPFKNLPKFGEEILFDEMLESAMRKLESQIWKAVCQIITPDPKFLAPMHTTPFLELDCIRNENEHSKEPIIAILRKALGIGEGVLIRDHVKTMGFKKPEKSVWITIALTNLIADFVFDSESPFDNTSFWEKQFEHLKIPPKMISMMIQDYRLQVMRAKPCPPNFMARRAKRVEEFVKKLNQTMHPLLSSNADTIACHKEIAAIADNLNTNIWAYAGADGKEEGSFRKIMPKFGAKFEVKRYELDIPDPDDPRPKNMDRHRVLVTMMFGISIILPDGTRPVCVPAKVRIME